ncbi:MMPL family transporter [Tsukamurella ocularis]|uniref:MMPL family transporter n=1 Tax=Tsukamurella ocularis TaxID=1970234 RepID=UPI0021683FE3|nr:MMPL family transporter [Tsukamurella ocularis]MCS3782306.1 RND superfamily putative drug exporter [Tsukamurella ocularis]MCS3789534.1 RND superfamily putative drug exporter [Tsukamurella ocularis]MCS3852681.1 RND superfamily putative drug exporter [Tsukamurella ocularis]
MTVIDAHSNSAAKQPFFARLGRLCVRYAAWILLFWISVAGVLNVAVPQLEVTVHKHSAPFIPGDLPGVDGLRAMAEEFGTPSSTAQGNVIISAEGKIGPEQEQYYRALTTALEADKEHVAYVIDTFGKPAAREVGLSPDGKAINLLVAEVGDIGSTRAQSSTEAIRATIRSIPAPAGTTVEFTGTAPTLSDLFTAIDASLLVITAVSVVLIMALLLITYRSIGAAMVPLLTIGLSLAVARPIVSLLGEHEVIPVSNFSIAIMTAMVLGAATDYAIFAVAGYHEARRAGAPSEEAAVAASTRVGRIIVASALTIAVASGAMIFCKVGIFVTAGLPTTISIIVTCLIALTLPPALLRFLGARGWVEPRPGTEKRWRRTGAKVMRRAVPLSAAALVVLLAAAAVLPSMVIGFDENRMQLRATDSRNGYETVQEHWGVNEAVPEFLLIRADHDMRNTHDLAALEAIAIGVSNLPQVAYVRSITRPDGKPIPESAVGYQTQQVANGLGDASRQLKEASPQLQALASGVDQLNAGASEASRRVPELVAGTQRVTGLASGVLDALTSAQQALATASGGTVDVNAATALLRSAVATLTTAADAVRTAQRQNAGIGDVFGPLVGPASPACTADVNCTAARRAFAELDRATSGRASSAVRAATVVLPAGTTDRAATALAQADDALARLQGLLTGLGALSPEQVKGQLAELNAGVTQLSTGLSQLSTGLGQVKTGTDQVVEMTGRLQEGLGTATDYLTGLSSGTTEGPGRGFYLPAQGLQSDRFVDGSRVLMSPDGRSARMLVVWGINPYSDEALNTSASIPDAARAAAKGTVLEPATMDGFGLASISAQMREQVLRDFLLFGLVAVIGVFLVLLVLLRAVIAAALMVATVVLSFAAAAGASVLLWQHGLGIPVDWSVLPIAFMALVAVGADYSMLFADRIREEAAGDSTVRGVLRAFGTTGSVITTAGLVFAITMFALMSGSVINLLQIGSTIGIGLLIDIVVVRTVFVPAAITALGDRVWWPSKP